MKRFGLALLAGVMFAALMVPPPAFACSCAYFDPRDALAESDGAIVGEFVSSRPGEPPTGSSTDDTIYTFNVVDEFKGDIPNPIDVHSPFSDFSCGLIVAPTEEYGLFMTLEDGEWSSNLCRQVSPETMRDAAAPLPDPDGQGPPAMLIGGSFGDKRVIALDDQGRTVAYGDGDGDVNGLSLCPDGTHSAEVVEQYPVAEMLAIRELAGLGVVSSRALPVDAKGNDRELVRDVYCAADAGAKVYFLALSYDEPFSQSRIIKVTGDQHKVVYKGSANNVVFDGNTAYVNAGRFGRKITKVNLKTGAESLIAKVSGYTGNPALSPNGDNLALVTYASYNEPGAEKLWLFDISEAKPKTTSRLLTKDHDFTFDAYWIDDETLAALGPRGPGGGRVFDIDLNELGRFFWGSNTAVVVGDEIYGTWLGNLEKAMVPDGPHLDVRTFPSPITYALLAL